MISFDLDFFPREDARGDEFGQFNEHLTSFLGDLSRHGNTVGNSIFLAFGDRVQARVQCIAPDALDESNLSEYARKNWDKIGSLSDRKPELQQNEEKQSWCDCQSPSFRLLYSHWNRLVSPLRCGDCWRDVPLYRLPLLDGPSKEHGILTTWLDNRENFEWLWLNSGPGERHAYYQLARPRSPFMKETRDLAGQLEAKTKVPTFAFLKHYYKKWDKHCPLCERKWKCKGPENMRFRCDHCRLLSEKPTDYRTPLFKLHP